jgi:CheY-like chemotaxis protein
MGETLIPDSLVKRSRIVPVGLDRPRSRGHQTDLLQGAVLVKKDLQPESPLSQQVDTPPNRSGSIIRVLLVDDHEPFRQFVRTTLNARPGTAIVSEVSDGLEAVQKAQELKPDLIVLDIGLPGLNGLEAARRIRKLSPQSIILFLSQESSAEVIQEALSVGATGFVIKVCAARDLMVAVDAVLRNQQFVSGAL